MVWNLAIVAVGEIARKPNLRAETIRGQLRAWVECARIPVIFLLQI